MKKLTFLLATFLMASYANAQVVFGENEKEFVKSTSLFSGIQPKKDAKPYLSGQEKFKLSAVGDNWFGSVKAGMSPFTGAPVGCTDFFGHTRPTMLVSFGKWHSRFFGTRLVYQGFTFTNADNKAMNYQNYHGDLMLNLSSFVRSSYNPLPRWDFALYLGAGAIKNTTIHKAPFAVSHGFLCSYRATNRLHITAEMGGTSTFQRFDGIGKDKHFGDNILHASLGVTIGIGKQGFDRKPVLEVLGDDGDHTSLLYDGSQFPKNDFEGLKSLKARMSKGEDGSLASSGIQLDAPILFFFKINTTTLIDKQQLVNIKEIAKAVNENDLRINIYGAADSKTGTPKHNQKLSVRRARYIAKLLMKAGVDKSKMRGFSRGGINIYKPYTANRHTCVIVYKEQQ